MGTLNCFSLSHPRSKKKKISFRKSFVFIRIFNFIIFSFKPHSSTLKVADIRGPEMVQGGSWRWSGREVPALPGATEQIQFWWSVKCIVSGAKTWWKQFLRQSSLKRCQTMIFFKWEILNATYKDQGNLLSHTLTQTLMVFIPSDTLLQTYGTN